MFWATIRSLDIGIEIRKDKFANSLLVAGELVKFLTTNTGLETIERLDMKLTLMKEKVEEAVKLAKASDKAAGTASNKIDELKRSLDTLMKRVNMLENKK